MNLDVQPAATIFMHQLSQATRIVARLSRIYIYMYMHIQQDSSKFRVFGDELHLGTISIPFKQE